MNRVVQNIKIGNIVKWILLLLTILSISPFFFTVHYALPLADDFANYDTIRSAMESGMGRFGAVSKLTIDAFMNWQGNYSGVFLLYFLLSFGELGIMGWRIAILINVILFFFSLWQMIEEINTFFVDKYRYTITSVLMLCLVLTGLNLTSSVENLYWLTGACIYTIPLVWCMMGITQYLKFYKNGESRNLILCVACGILAAGGVLQVSAIVCFAYLVILGMDWIKRGIRFERAIPFFGVLSGALINTIAPGNYVRYNSKTSEGLQVFEALINAAKMLYNRMMCMLKLSYLPCIVVIFILIIICSTIKFKQLKVCPIWIWLLGGMGIYISVFPVALGYNSPALLGRVTFIMDVCVALYVMLGAAHTAIWVKQHLKLVIDKRKWLFGIGAAVIICANCMWTYGNKMILPTMISELIDGTMEKHCSEQTMILQEIDATEDLNVVIEIKGARSEILYDIGLTEDKTHWINREIAEFYEKESICVLTK